MTLNLFDDYTDNAQSEWVTVRHRHLLPARVVMALFRDKLVAGLRRALERNELILPEGTRPQQWRNPDSTRFSGKISTYCYY